MPTHDSALTESTDTSAPVLEVDQLATHFASRAGTVRAVDGVSVCLHARQTVGVVGESGCGKSVTALSIMRLLATPPAHHAGAVRFRGLDLLTLSEPRMRQIRGNRISMIFQEPMTSLNPVLSVGRQIAETVQVHQHVGRSEAMRRAVEMLGLVQIPDAKRRAAEYPHQFSGGQRQRVMIGLALACRPDVLIADEPTTALDVTIQAQILELIKRLQAEMGMAVLLITHDLGVVAQCCDRVVVMYAGRKVEEADVIDLFETPRHPYTRALMGSMPSMAANQRRLTEIPGMVPAPHELPRGCAFADRCALVEARCRLETPLLKRVGKDHQVACFVAEAAAQGPELARA